MKLSRRVLVDYEEVARARSSRTERLRRAIRRSLRAISAKAILGVRLVGRNHSYSMRAHRRAQLPDVLSPRPRLQLLQKARRVRIHDSDCYGAQVNRSRNVDRWRIGWWCRVADPLDLEITRYGVTIADNSDVGWNRDFDISHHAPQLHLRGSRSEPRHGEIELDVSHEAESAESARKDPLVVTLGAGPPGNDPTPLGDKILRKSADGNTEIGCRAYAIWWSHVGNLRFYRMNGFSGFAEYYGTAELQVFLIKRRNCVVAL